MCEGVCVGGCGGVWVVWGCGGVCVCVCVIASPDWPRGTLL